MTFYAAVKIAHILGTVLLFGTGLGTAFFLLMAYRSRDIDAIRVTAGNAIELLQQSGRVEVIAAVSLVEPSHLAL